MTTKEQLKADMDAWDGVNIYLYKQAKKAYKQATAKKAKVKEEVKKGLSKSEFYKLLRAEQIELLKGLNIVVRSSDNEFNLWVRYKAKFV